MKNTLFDKLSNLFIIITLLYCVLFISYHFFTPNIGELDINITSSTSTPESQMVTLSTPKVLDHYYLLIYPESSDDYWIYFSPAHSASNADEIKSLFLPDSKKKYILLEGNNYKESFSFTLNAKYPLSYIANKEHVFHVDYIVPYKIFPFPPFYYSKHYIFFINPLI